MSFYEDLSEYEYYRKEQCTYNIGWLDGSKEFKRGKVDAQLVENLWEFIKFPILEMRGFYSDEKLIGKNHIVMIKDGSYFIQLGTAEIRVIDEKFNRIYAAPNLIIYYIIEHNYLPPKCFIDAVLSSPKPNSSKYSDMIKTIIPKREVADKNNCLFCGSNKLDYGFRHSKDFENTQEIQILNLPISEFPKDTSVYQDMICTSCGKIGAYPIL